ncbi:MAG: hypothetical protein KGJ55_09050, partial [Gammaproteobacteria bacterium]|nr:hypothetical protein [Gammaproteobacteria bacterium]
MRHIRLCWTLALCTVLVACATTPADRVREHPEVFSQATPEQQALIQKGRIGIGFTPPLVELALGKPDRITERTNQHGTETVWHYTESRGGYYGYPLYSPFFYGPFYGPYYGSYYGSYYSPYWAPYYGGSYYGGLADGGGDDRDRV